MQDSAATIQSSVISKTSKPSRIFVFASYNNDDVNEVYWQFAEKCGYSILTCEKKVFEICQRKNIHAVLLPSQPSKFKRLIRNVDIQFLVSAGDSYHGIFNYLAQHYPSAYLQGIDPDTLHSLERQANRKSNLFYLRLYTLLGLTATLFGKKQIIYPESFRGVIRAVVDKIIWRSRLSSVLHGNFCDLVFLQGEWEREIYIRNGIASNKLRVTGAIQADWVVGNLSKWVAESKNHLPASDLLFFSQPLYEHAGLEPKYLEELEILVDACRQMRLQLTIKLHPRDDINMYKQFESNTCRLIVHHRDWSDANNVTLIKNTKVVISKGSTSILPALLLQKPVMYLDLFNSHVLVYKYFMDLKLHVQRIVDFEEKFLFAIDPGNATFIQEHQKQLLANLGYFDGRSWERIKNEIDEFCENSWGFIKRP